MSDFGYFSQDGSEYVITDYKPPRILMNYMWNDKFFSGVNHFGSGEGCYIGHAAKYNDSKERGKSFLINGGNRYFYIRDEETGEFWNPGWYPVKRNINNYSCTCGLGYSIIQSEYNGVSVSLRGFVDKEDPVEIWTIKIKNNSSGKKDIKVFSFVEFSLIGYEQYCGMQAYSYCKFFKDSNMVFAYNNAIEKPHGWYNGYIASNDDVTGFDSSKEKFFGSYGDASSPIAVKDGNCSNSEASSEGFCGALENQITLNSCEEKTFNIIIGSTNSVETATSTVKRLFTKGTIESEFQQLKEKNKKMIDDIVIITPDKRLNSLVNNWIKQQIQLCIEVGRGSMKGFRDQLQDSWGAASINPEMARRKILETLANEYSDGRCVRGFSPIDPHIYSDGPVWIAPAINGYIKETGDETILDEKTPYLDGGQGTVWEHILIAVRHSSDDIGERGLVLARDGDWNDSLNLMGIGGKGESVWTSIALYNALLNTAEISRYIKNDTTIETEMVNRANMIKNSVNTNGWDGEWYLAGYNDKGEKVGTKSEKEGRIYLNSQTWAVYSGIADEEKKNMCIESVDKNLNSQYGPLTLYPAYTKLNSSIGRLTGFVPGIWENGTPYCHGGTFKVVADCCANRPNEAYESIKKILPDSDQNPCDHSGCEPYALTNMYYGPDHQYKGKTLFGWVTGTAGWMFRAITEYIFGFHPEYDHIRIAPCIPDEWPSCSMKRKFRGDTYLLRIVKVGRKNIVAQIKVDNEIIQGNICKIFNDGKEHSIDVLIN